MIEVVAFCTIQVHNTSISQTTIAQLTYRFPNANIYRFILRVSIEWDVRLNPAYYFITEVER